MIKQIQNNQDPDMVRIEYMPGNTCNHKCHYCFPGSNEGDMKWPDVDLVKKNLGHLLKHFESQGKTKSNIFIIGGEPTLWKGLEDLCKYLKSNFDCIIEMNTNGTRKPNWWKKHAMYFDRVGVSVHNEYANIDHLINVCDILYEQGTFINADVLMDPNDFEKCVDIIEKLKTSKYAWPIIAKVVHFNGMHRYTDTQLEFFNDSIKRYPTQEWYDSTSKLPRTEITITKDNNETIKVNSDSWLTRNKLNFFNGWECNLGVDFLKIFPNGNITGNCQQSILGNQNLYDSEFTNTFMPSILPIICSKNICGCSEEINCNKRKINV